MVFGQNLSAEINCMEIIMHGHKASCMKPATVYIRTSQEIELVITRLEEETAHGREEGERALEGRIRRVRDKYETELREVERSERTTLEKFNSMKVGRAS